MSASSSTRPDRSRVRYAILLMLFVASSINYADRATLSITGSDVSRQLGLSKIAMGYAFSAFGWAYALGQIPGGWLLDRFGSARVYLWSIVAWSAFTFLQGFVGAFDAAIAVVVLFLLRFLLGLAEAPSFPGNGRIVAAWFPTAERGTASAVFNSAQYFATAMFAPITGWITFRFGWPYVFFVMGVLGVALAIVWARVVHAPANHPRVSAHELEHIARGGALVDMDRPSKTAANGPAPRRSYIRQLLGNRMLLGIYVAQYCITTMTYFFLTWFPVYLVEQRGMSILRAGIAASLPAICGFAGGVLGGVISDRLLRLGYSLNVARKVPIVAGMLLSTSMILCNGVDSAPVVVGLMALAFFGKGIGSLGWAVVSDTSPKQIAGLSGALFNMFGNTAGITTPIVIGYIVQWTHSFNGALIFVAANAIVAVVAYVFIVGNIERVELETA
ncbi:MAG TPA: MFS transporter [Vicinamibacterales bacterium]|nr:MFS transporter [Vicinamibacterales bacterium]